MASATLLTPTYAGDLARFALLRESIERFEIDLAHLAVVHTEDLPAFKAIPFRRNLTLLPTCDVLAPDIEQRRLFQGLRRRNPRRWFRRPPIHGWFIQQLVKLSAGKVIESDAIVCIDSDNFFCAHVRAEDFFDTNGKVHLYETNDDLDAEMGEWPARSMRFLGVKTTGRPLWRYTHHPAVMHRGVLEDMLEFVAGHSGVRWEDAFVNTPYLTEYTTYGVYAREIDGLARVEPVRPLLSTYYWWPGEFEDGENRVRGHPPADLRSIISIQSNLGVSIERQRKFAENVWRAKCNVAIA
jgi:hypothetical protein